MKALPLALAILLAAGSVAGLPGGLALRGGVAGEYPDAAEIPTDGRRVEALGPAPLGALGAALQLVVVLACPAICLGLGVLRRFEGCGRPPAPDVERGSGQENG
ncbi:MAG: hypothetical protein ACREJS_00655 [Candidatus Rokuibacteriota bacterium]